MGKRLTIDEFIAKAKAVHGEKYDYSMANYTNAHDKIQIICSAHGSFLQRAASHLRGYGCFKCCSDICRCSTTEFIQKAKEIHGEKYDYSKVNYINNSLKIKIICQTHGEFVQIPNNHLHGAVCLKCGKTNCSEKLSLSQKECIEKFHFRHGNFYDYSMVKYKNHMTPVVIKCNRCCHIFSQIPNSHLKGRGCPRCKLSMGEASIIRFLEFHNIIYVHQKKFNNLINPITKYHLKYDFYLPKFNVLIEFDGRQHYDISKLCKHIMTKKELKYIQFKDRIKTCYARQNKIKLVRIPYTKLKQIDDILSEELL